MTDKPAAHKSDLAAVTNAAAACCSCRRVADIALSNKSSFNWTFENGKEGPYRKTYSPDITFSFIADVDAHL